MAWKSVATVFRGGSDEAKKLFGKKVKLNYDVSTQVVDGKSGQSVDFKKGMTGFVGYVPAEAQDHISIAFPNDQKNIPTTADELLRSGKFHVIRVNWPTFRERFDIEI